MRSTVGISDLRDHFLREQVIRRQRSCRRKKRPMNKPILNRERRASYCMQYLWWRVSLHQRSGLSPHSALHLQFRLQLHLHRHGLSADRNMTFVDIENKEIRKSIHTDRPFSSREAKSELESDSELSTEGWTVTWSALISSETCASCNAFERRYE